jgi:hypothetical protein
MQCHCRGASLAIIEMMAHMELSHDDFVFQKGNFYAQKKHQNTELLGLFWTLSIHPIALYNIHHRQNPFKSNHQNTPYFNVDFFLMYSTKRSLIQNTCLLNPFLLYLTVSRFCREPAMQSCLQTTSWVLST